MKPFGDPDPAYISTSYVERQNLSVRMTPAAAAGVTDRLWEVSDLVALLEAEEQRSRGAA